MERKRKSYAVVALLTVVALAGTWLWIDAADRAAAERDDTRRAVVMGLKRTLDARPAGLPAADGSLTQASASGGLAELSKPPTPPAASDAVVYAVDDAARHYLVCTKLEDGSAYYATGQGTFAGPALSCAETADPVAVGYVLDAQMTPAGADRYLETRPALVSKSFIQRECAAAVDEGQLQGCYTGDHIYLIDLPQQAIRPEVSVTAAHEMLHAVWERLPGKEREAVTRLLENAAGENGALRERVGSYSDETRINELHSIAGTEFPGLEADLERHYDRFLRNRPVIVQRHLAYERILDGLKAEIDRLKAELDRLGAQADTRLAAGDIAGYNGLVGPYNALVAEANEKVHRYNDLTAHTRPGDRQRTVEGR